MADRCGTRVPDPPRRRLARGVSAALVGLSLGAVVLWGCRADQSSSQSRPVVGLVFDVGGLGDKSFNDAAYRGLLRARDSLGIDFEILEPPSGADREPSLRKMAASDLKLVFGVGFLFSDDIRHIAEEFPDRHFACVDYSLKDGETLPPNLTALRFREEEGSFLVGALAALTSKTGKIGFVGGMDIPLIHRFQAGYEAGAEHAREDVTVFVSYAGVTGEAFANPSKGKELALAQYESGADVIFHAAGATGLGVFEAARQTRRFAIGVDSDQYEEAPGRILSSMVKRVDVAVFETIKAELAGRFSGGVRELGLAERGVDYVYDDHNRELIDDDVHAQVEAYRDDIVSGRVTVPRTR